MRTHGRRTFGLSMTTKKVVRSDKIPDTRIFLFYFSLCIYDEYILSRESLSASGYIFRFTFRSLFDVSYSDECRTKKAFQYAKRMLPLFRAKVKFCSANRLFTYFRQRYYFM